MDKTPSSFSKSLFFGHIPEEMVIPYPQATAAERGRIREILAALRAFAAENVDAAAIDATSRIPAPVLAGLRERGFFGLSVPSEYGGLGLSTTGYARVSSELAAIDASLAVTLSAHEALGLRGLLLHGTAEQRRRHLPSLASGEKVAAFALTEPGSGSDAASIQTRATPQPDGSFILDGDKTWITNGGIADLFTIFAQTEVERGGERKNRITAFLVERGMGVVSGPEEGKLGVRGASMTSLTLRNLRVPAENVLGQLGGGFKVAMGVLNVGRLAAAAGTVGAAQELIRLAIAHAVKRRQFGRPISEFGLVKDKIGRLMLDVFAAESMVYLTTGMVDRGVQDCSLESAICKVAGSEMLQRVANESAAIAAGASYVTGHPWERLLRDARVHLVFQGTNEILRCFIALSGMQGPGERLAQLTQFIKWPLKGYGLAIDFVVDKLKTQYVGNGATVEHAHGMLKRETVLFEDNVPELAKQVEKTLRKHGREISEMQYVQRRVADMTIDLYMMVACIARTTASILEKGAPAAEREAKLCRAVCGRAAQRIRRNIRMFDDNDDELVKAVAKDAYDAGRYDFDVVLG